MALIELMPYIVYIEYNWIEWEIERMRENELECIEVDIDFFIHISTSMEYSISYGSMRANSRTRTQCSIKNGNCNFIIKTN